MQKLYMVVYFAASID